MQEKPHSTLEIAPEETGTRMPNHTCKHIFKVNGLFIEEIGGAEDE